MQARKETDQGGAHPEAFRLRVEALPGLPLEERALAEIAARTGASTLLTAGDSLLDRGMLLAADRAIRPRHGELEDEDWRPDGLSVTQHTGGRAADDIVAWFGVDYGVVLT